MTVSGICLGVLVSDDRRNKRGAKATAPLTGEGHEEVVVDDRADWVMKPNLISAWIQRGALP